MAVGRLGLCLGPRGAWYGGVDHRVRIWAIVLALNANYWLRSWFIADGRIRWSLASALLAVTGAAVFLGLYGYRGPYFWERLPVFPLVLGITGGIANALVYR